MFIIPFVYYSILIILFALPFGPLHHGLHLGAPGKMTNSILCKRLEGRKPRWIQGWEGGDQINPPKGTR